MKLWIVCQFIADGDPHPAWAFIGAFSTEEKAVSACIKENYGYFPWKLDKVAPDKVTKAPHFAYPLNWRSD